LSRVPTSFSATFTRVLPIAVDVVDIFDALTEASCEPA
jgi:hypothetical protein